MNIKNIKTNMFYFDKISSKKGIALLFAVMLSAIFLSIALGVSSIALKELNFSSSAKDSDNAFFAADSGVECALYNDKLDSTVFIEKGEPVIFCFGVNRYEVKNSIGETSMDFSFNVSGLGSNGQSCVAVDVLKTIDRSTDPMTILSTKITSKGYNLGRDDCSWNGENRVERVLEVNY